MKIVCVNRDTENIIKVYNRQEFIDRTVDRVINLLYSATDPYAVGYTDFTQYCNFKKIPLIDLPKVLNSIRTLITNEIYEKLKEKGYEVPLKSIGVLITGGVCVGQAMQKYVDDKVVRDYNQQWIEINEELYCGKKYSVKEFQGLKERKSQIYRKRQVMYIRVEIKIKN